MANITTLASRKISKTLFAFRALFFVSTVLCGYGFVCAQSAHSKINFPIRNPFEKDKILLAESIRKDECFFAAKNKYSFSDLSIKEEKAEEKSGFKLLQTKSEIESCDESEKTEDVSVQVDPAQKNKDKFHWKPALKQSLLFLGLQHATRISTQRRTNRELGGPFFRDWFKSIEGLRGWEDGDNIFVNYVAHPLQGGLTGRIFINNSDKAKRQEFGKSKEYWQSRLKTMAWSAAWSTQFEIGPISEASLGNLGLRQNSHYKSTYLDLIITPTIGTGVIIGEDAVDKYILKNWLEKKNGYQVTNKIRIWRSILTPSISFANLLRWQVPWKRNDR